MHDLDIVRPNDAWILHREDVDTVKDGNCNVYALLDAYSGFCFGMVTAIEMPSNAQLVDLLQEARTKAKTWPKQALIVKQDPLVETFKTIGKDLKVETHALPARDLQPYTQPFSESFFEFKTGKRPHEWHAAVKEEIKAFIPDTYDPCPCASGKKFKFCCQPCFKEITFAMCASERGNLEEALHFMQEAASKVGQTAEILCRYAICWSFFDQQKYLEYLKQAAELNSNHPRTNYILGIEAAAEQDYAKAVLYYRKAIEYYPKEDRYHLNEAYNNLGTAYFSMKCYQESKEAWEKALVLFPTDETVYTNLTQYIYENLELPHSIREKSLFIQKYLERHLQSA